MHWTLLILLTPMFVLILVAGAVAIVALLQANDDDVPVIWTECARLLSALGLRVPRPGNVPPGEPTPLTEQFDGSLPAAPEEPTSPPAAPEDSQP